MIELRDISFSYDNSHDNSYDKAPALADISLNIEQGESVSLLGSNGSGKSTLLKLLNGLIFADSGTYRFDGEEITKKRLEDERFAKLFHQRMGFIFQNSDTQLFCADVYDEIAFGPRQMGHAEAEVRERTEDLLELLHLKGFEHRQPYHLSGGEQRKVALAAVLSMNPDVLVLDEPMNGLDPKTERWLAEFLVRLNESGKTIILSTHNIGLVQEISKRSILFSEDHRIVADLETARLLDDIDLLKQVNLVDQYYHKHESKDHSHFHIHNY
ncbi:MAG: energy-coupling factor ABC transporter ATP-binding protein [Clostridiales Family XIII bacterium]|jgi:cobalt/nickel transport system ATP-binding protein|nr:energy-coupling factor ABC transporter ATP-binding protein [Clostridiales Family XIII bacterium]